MGHSVEHHLLGDAALNCQRAAGSNFLFLFRKAVLLCEQLAAEGTEGRRHGPPHYLHLRQAWPRRISISVSSTCAWPAGRRAGPLSSQSMKPIFNSEDSSSSTPISLARAGEHACGASREGQLFVHATLSREGFNPSRT